jgi:hypothetical protein
VTETLPRRRPTSGTVRIFAHWNATADLEGNPIGAAKDCGSGVLRWTAW